MSRDLAPPVVMRHKERAKDPLPAIGCTNNTPQRPAGGPSGGGGGLGLGLPPPPAVSSPPHSSSAVDSPSAVSHAGSSSQEHSPPKALDESPTMVGSLALARRRQHRGSPDQAPEGGGAVGRSPSPQDYGEQDSLSEPRRQHIHRVSPLADVLDADTHGTLLLPTQHRAHRPDGVSPVSRGGVSPTSRHHGKLEPLEMGHPAAKK